MINQHLHFYLNVQCFFLNSNNNNINYEIKTIEFFNNNNNNYYYYY